jgi:hypothetical protein
MDPKTIQQLAELIGSQLSSHLPTIFAVQFVATLVAAAIATVVGSFLSEYFKTKGKTLATKADFDELQRQLAKQTEAVETIKSEISRRDWAQREWQNLPRTKIEALIEKMHDCGEFLEKHGAAARRAESLTDRDPLNELSTIATLYFPELSNEADKYTITCREMLVENSRLALELKKTDDDKANSRAYSAYKLKLDELVPVILDAGSVGLSNRGEAAADGIREARGYKNVLDLRGSGRNVHQTVVAHDEVSALLSYADGSTIR